MFFLGMSLSWIWFMDFYPLATRDRSSITDCHTTQTVHTTLDCISHHPMHWVHAVITNHMLTWNLYITPTQILLKWPSIVLCISLTLYYFQLSLVISCFLFPACVSWIYCCLAALFVLNLDYCSCFWTTPWCKIESTSDGLGWRNMLIYIKVSKKRTVNHNSKIKQYIWITICNDSICILTVSTILVENNYKSNRIYLEPFKKIKINLELIQIIWNE